MTLSAHYEATGIGLPGDRPMLVGPRREVARGAGPVGRNDVHVTGAVEYPSLVVELAEEALDPARCLPALVLGLVALVRRATDERDPPAIRAPGDLVDGLLH